jgi:hypothetical protein
LIGWIAQTWTVQTAIITGGIACLLGISFVQWTFMQKAFLRIRDN